MNHCLVTGAAGFIGFHVCRQLSQGGATVVGVDNLNSYYDPQLKKDRLSQLALFDKFRFQKTELADKESTEALFRDNKFDAVFHMAAQPGVRYSIENPHAYIESNIVAFVNVLEGCRHHGSPHLVYASSSSVYGGNKKTPFSVGDPVENPVSLYAATKRSNELTANTYSQLYSMPITGLRFFTVYGPWGRPDMAVYKFANAMMEGRAIDVYNHGQMRRDFTYIDDIVDGVLRAAEASLSRPPEGARQHRLYNLGNNQPVELDKLIEALETALGVAAKKRLLSMQPGDVLETFADIDLSIQDLGFSPRTSITEGIRRFVDWRQSYHTDSAMPATA